MGEIATVHNLAGGNFDKGLAPMHRSFDLSFHVCAVNLLCLKFLYRGSGQFGFREVESSGFLWSDET